MKLRVILGSLALVGIVLLVGGGLAYVKYSEIMTAMNSPPPPESGEAVVLASVGARQYRESITAIGTVVAPKSVTLRTESSGSVEKIYLESGSTVEEGKLLIQLESSVENAQLESAEARLKIANSTLTRTKRAGEVNAVTELEIEEAEAEQQQAVAEVSRLKAVIRKKSVFAPFRARVGLVDTHIGQYLQEGSLITTLQGIEDYQYVDFMLPQSVSETVRVGNEVRFSYYDRSETGAIVALDSQADRSTRNVMARAKLMNPPASLQPGDSVKVLIEYGPTLSVPSVPVESLRRSPQGAYVYTADLDEKNNLRAHERTVVAGATVGSDVLILHGVKTGEQIVADGSFKLREGMMLAEKPRDPTNPNAGKDDAVVTPVKDKETTTKASEDTTSTGQHGS